MTADKKAAQGFDEHSTAQTVPALHPISWPMEGVSGETGSWRLERPVIDHQACTKCLRCWVFCPEGVISRDTLEINYTYCKGCGICGVECACGAITMVKEG